MRWVWGRTGTTIWRNSGGISAPWIDGYTTPKPGRYHAGMRAGELSQTGLLTVLLLRSVVERGGYDEADFARRLDEELLPRLDGTPKTGPGGYTNQDMRDVYRRRVKEGRPWGECASPVDTAEAAQRLPVLAARYAADPAGGAAAMAANCLLTQNDGLTVSLSVAFGCVLSALIRGEPMDGAISDKLMDLVHDGALPFGHVAARGNRPPGSGRTGVHGDSGRAFPVARRGAPAGLLRGSGARPGDPDRAGVEGLRAVQPALRDLRTAAGGVLSGSAFRGGVRGAGAARAQRRRPEPQPCGANRRAGRGASGPERDSPAVRGRPGERRGTGGTGPAGGRILYPSGESLRKEPLR